MKPRDKTAAECAAVGRPQAIRDALQHVYERDKTEEPVLTRSFMNYASAPLGAKKYDASTLATGTGVGRVG